MPAKARQDGRTEYTCFIVEHGTPGFKAVPMHKKMMWRASNTAELYFDDVNEHVFLCQEFELIPQLVYLHTFSSDHDARTSGKNVNRNLFRGTPLYFDFGNTGPSETLLYIPSQHDIFFKIVLKISLTVPARIPGFRNPEPEPYGMSLLSQVINPLL